MAVQLDYRDEIARITLNRPAQLNALNFATLEELSASFDAVASSSARALIITGTGPKAFCAGADISELAGRTIAQCHEATVRGQLLFQRLVDFPMPSVALINGYALGGGLELALACTFRLAVASARMGLPEIKLGLVPGYGGTQRLPRLVGVGMALDMVLTGRSVEAEEALRIGLVNLIVGEPPLDAAIEFCKTFTKFGLPALRLAAGAVQRGADMTLLEGLRLEADLSTLSYQTADGQEGLHAFLKGRPPRFQDR